MNKTVISVFHVLDPIGTTEVTVEESGQAATGALLEDYPGAGDWDNRKGIKIIHKGFLIDGKFEEPNKPIKLVGYNPFLKSRKDG